MLLTSDHHEAHLYLATKGSEQIGRLLQLDTETGKYIQLALDGVTTVEDVCDRLFIKAGNSDWVRLPLGNQAQ